ncbi:hypothetical protein CC86DRAFT_281065 [Ophiobolus disseminans]|uniref:Uncharacterized protein n=1 Tax=Ophiobolus disseminans TaxID=1469910 RepID=A0A6A7AIS9_9PLEO|nr:hypothetical protein CC86DRAFT_281065 [Ophiobolus disseminans]
MALQGLDLDLQYFFTTLLPMNAFIGDGSPGVRDLKAAVNTSPALRDAIQAISLQHRPQQLRTTIPGMAGNCEAYKLEALRAYARSVRDMQKRIASNAFLGNSSALWTTFFLGLFELMRDPTGDNWLSHFLHGTCTILRLQRPDSMLGLGADSGQRRAFFLATRIFEIARSLIYSSPTFLGEAEWVDALAQLWRDEGAALWHPKEALFDILPMTSDLSIRAIDFCDRALQFTPEAQYAMSLFLANEGLILQQMLRQWWTETADWERHVQTNRSQLKTPSRPDTELLIAQVYYHAISIYLSGTFDYHMHWAGSNGPDAPMLSRSQIDQHVSKILLLSHALLILGVSGILLFFPLRVAGARATDDHARNEIMGLLQTTVVRGFVVAEAFQVDLSELWGGKSLYL